MRNEGLDPAGKVELAGLLLQIGFKVEALTEYLMAAQMYAERGQQEQAIKLYEKVLSIDETNQIARRGLERVKGLTVTDIDDIVARMGFGEKPSQEEPARKEPPRLEEPETVTPLPVSAETFEEKKTVEPAVFEEPVPEQKVEIEPSVDLSDIEIEEFFSSIEPIIAKAADNPSKREELASFFKDEELWIDSFFEKKSSYREKRSLEELNVLLSLLSHTEDREILISFLEEENRTELDAQLKEVILETLAKTYEESGKTQQAADIRKQLEELGGKKRQGAKIIGDIPELSDDKQNPPGDDKPSGPIHFI